MRKIHQKTTNALGFIDVIYCTMVTNMWPSSGWRKQEYKYK